MRVVIVGAGAMGGLFAALLREAGHEVWLLSRQKTHATAINTRGVRIQSNGKERSVAVTASMDPAAIPTADICLIFVKSPDTARAAEAAAQLVRPDGWVVTLQNGLGNADTLAQFTDAHRIVAGTTAHGATLLAPGRIRHAGNGPTVVGMWDNPDAGGAHVVARCFNDAGIETRVTAHVRQKIWEKLLVNVGINAITALTGIRNGIITDCPSARRLCREAVEEASRVATAVGITVPEDMVSRVFQVARATAGNRSSMGQDVDRRKPTEIGVINGAVVKMADEMGMAAPVNRTLTSLIEILEADYKRNR